MLKFVMVGPRKTASTWLHDYFCSHPEVELPALSKETFFFDRFFKKGIEWYENAYFESAGKSVCGEFSPSYFSHPHAAHRISGSYPGCRVVICLRSPVERLLSDYKHHRRYGLTKASLQDAVLEKNDLLSSTRYSKHVAAWKAVFPAECLKVLYYEDFVASKDSFIDEFTSFVGVESVPVPPDLEGRRSNAAGSCVNPLVARLASKTTWVLRGAGMNRTIEALKTIGVKKLIYGRERPGESLQSTEELHEVASSLLVEEMQAYANRSY